MAVRVSLLEGIALVTNANMKAFMDAVVRLCVLSTEKFGGP